MLNVNLFKELELAFLLSPFILEISMKTFFVVVMRLLIVLWSWRTSAKHQDSQTDLFQLCCAVKKTGLYGLSKCTHTNAHKLLDPLLTVCSTLSKALHIIIIRHRISCFPFSTKALGKISKALLSLSIAVRWKRINLLHKYSTKVD